MLRHKMMYKYMVHPLCWEGSLEDIVVSRFNWIMYGECYSIDLICGHYTVLLRDRRFIAVHVVMRIHFFKILPVIAYTSMRNLDILDMFSVKLKLLENVT